VSIHRPPPLTPLVDDYLDAAPVSAVHVLGARDGRLTKIVAGPKRIAGLPAAVEWRGAWWCVGEGLAAEIARRCYQLFVDGKFAFYGAWCEFPAEKARTVVITAAEHMMVPLLADAEARLRAAIEVAKIDAEFEDRRAKGALRTVNQDYRRARTVAQGGGTRRFPTYSAYVLELRRKAVRTHAERLGAQVMAAGDMRLPDTIEIPEE
jgi:hypothetical protein